MALKTFNLDEKTYKKFSSHCKKEGISMSKKIEKFIQRELERIEDVQPATSNHLLTSVTSNSSKSKSDDHPLSKYC